MDRLISLIGGETEIQIFEFFEILQPNSLAFDGTKQLGVCLSFLNWSVLVIVASLSFYWARLFIIELCLNHSGLAHQILATYLVSRQLMSISIQMIFIIFSITEVASVFINIIIYFHLRLSPLILKTLQSLYVKICLTSILEDFLVLWIIDRKIDMLITQLWKLISLSE